MTRIFISYRRDDAGGYSLLLFQRLVEHFGRGRIFMDIDTIEPGVDFVDMIERAVGACDALIALVGKHWLTLEDDKGRRRIDNPEDFVRLEIAAALARQVRVIPVLVRGAQMPASDELPDPIMALARRNAFELSDARIQYDLDRLIQVLDKSSRKPMRPTQSWLDRLERFETQERVLEAGASLADGVIAQVGTRRLFEPEVVEVPGGVFLAGENDERVELPGIAIGKYPVRVLEFRAFVQGGGYDEARFWTGAGWDWRQRVRRSAPEHWNDPLWCSDDWLPVVGVTFFEAMAYCNWLAEQTDRPYRLPTSLEWEKAARGPEGRIYPWGSVARQGVCNIHASGIHHTTRTGTYSPAGDSFYGVTDLIGNVQEWTLSAWDAPTAFASAVNTDGRAARVQHGGSWASAGMPRPCQRFRAAPDTTANFIGFRVALGQ